MTAEQRKQRILDLLKENDTVRVTNLSRQFGVSEVTIRSDLEDMEKKGLLSRVHGGAVSSYKPYYSMNLNQRLETNQKAKVAIAERVAELIQPNDTVMLNAGTTTLLVFRKLRLRCVSGHATHRRRKIIQRLVLYDCQGLFHFPNCQLGTVKCLLILSTDKGIQF